MTLPWPSVHNFTPERAVWAMSHTHFHDQWVLGRHHYQQMVTVVCAAGPCLIKINLGVCFTLVHTPPIHSFQWSYTVLNPFLQAFAATVLLWILLHTHPLHVCERSSDTLQRNCWNKRCVHCVSWRLWLNGAVSATGTTARFLSLHQVVTRVSLINRLCHQPSWSLIIW